MYLQPEVQTSLVFSCVIYMMVYSGSCTDYTMDCDSGTQTLTGTVDTSLLDGTNCLFGAVDKVKFKIVYPNGDEDEICTVPYPECNQDSHEKNGQMCRCESSSGNINTYQLKFCFEESYANTKLRITSNCVPATGQHVFTYTDCDTPDTKA
ncbi:uncharacterized protein LOC143277518 [Babylonia areolata]|uniref:uncharacterized protein LOC143277518 n=1 Tax=Babylonia areolata TaxID=304850 RepID=UPI003FD2AD3B